MRIMNYADGLSAMCMYNTEANALPDILLPSNPQLGGSVKSIDLTLYNETVPVRWCLNTALMKALGEFMHALQATGVPLKIVGVSFGVPLTGPLCRVHISDPYMNPSVFSQIMVDATRIYLLSRLRYPHDSDLPRPPGTTGGCRADAMMVTNPSDMRLVYQEQPDTPPVWLDMRKPTAPKKPHIYPFMPLVEYEPTLEYVDDLHPYIYDQYNDLPWERENGRPCHYFEDLNSW